MTLPSDAYFVIGACFGIGDTITKQLVPHVGKPAKSKAIVFFFNFLAVNLVHIPRANVVHVQDGIRRGTLGVPKDVLHHKRPRVTGSIELQFYFLLSRLYSFGTFSDHSFHVSNTAVVAIAITYEEGNAV